MRAPFIDAGDGTRARAHSPSRQTNRTIITGPSCLAHTSRRQRKWIAFSPTRSSARLPEPATISSVPCLPAHRSHPGRPPLQLQSIFAMNRDGGAATCSSEKVRNTISNLCGVFWGRRTSSCRSCPSNGGATGASVHVASLFTSKCRCSV